jgi:hypothetical protein
MLTRAMNKRSLLRILPLFFVFWPAVAVAQGSRGDQVPLGELIEVVVMEDEILAVDAESGGTSITRLQLGEEVLWVGTRGLLGVVVTDRRVLAVGTGSSSWQEIPYERGERPPREADLGDRLALVTLSRRVLGFLGTTSRFAEVRLGPHEALRVTRVGANVAVVVTDRQAFGLSPDAGRFFSIRLQLREKLVEVQARSNLATVRTDQRVLVFRGRRRRG